MLHERLGSRPPGRPMYLRAIVWLLLGCVGLVGFRAVQVGLEAGWITTGRASTVARQDIQQTADNDRPIHAAHVAEMNASQEVGTASSDEASQPESLVRADLKLHDEGVGPPINDSKVAITSGNEPPPMKTVAAGAIEAERLNVVGLLQSLDNVAVASEVVTREARRWANALATAVKPQFDGLRGPPPPSVSGPFSPSALSSPHADFEVVGPPAGSSVGPPAGSSVGPPAGSVVGPPAGSVDEPDLARPRTGESAATAVLVNSANGAVNYLLNGHAYSLKPGQTHVLGEGGTWTIRYHRGGKFGNASHHVRGGTHQFAVTGNGWELQPR